ncbi:MAG TPA: efflux RND transporter periplasmic adaptor subunit [Terracidiphilus sp.]|nr:efflux RND transporter periplasmic adaptor subunit [Terracidiphilus sp.]
MNKYIVRTSLVWLGVLALSIAGLLVYRRHSASPSSETISSTNSVQPVAEGPAQSASSQPAGMPGAGEAGAQVTAQAPLTPLQLTPQQMQSIGVETGTVAYKRLTNDVRATGTVDIDERLLSYVQVRFPGYIRNVFVNATYLYVRKGEPLFSVYSPDLVATEQEYLLARQNQKALSTSTVNGVASGAAALTGAAEQRLLQWEVPPSELQKLQQTEKPIVDLTINSPVSGYVTEYNALPNMYVQPSTRLYTVADLSRVWVYAQVFQDQVGELRPGGGAEITVDSYPGRTFRGYVVQILPQVDLATRTVRVRLEVGNRGLLLKPGMFVNVDLKANMGRQLVVPASAVFQTGTKQVVFLNQGNGSLQPKEVTIGPRFGDNYVVLQGLKAGQSIVTSANFLIDSESQLQAAAGSLAPPPPGTRTDAALSPNQGTIAFSSSPDPARKGENVFRVRLTETNGSPISGAQVMAAFFMAAMPAMGMSAMKTAVTLTDKGNGLYEGVGTLGSSGTWQVTVRAQKNGQTIVTKQFGLTVARGNAG